MGINYINGEIIFTRPTNWSKQKLIDYEFSDLSADEIDDTVAYDFGTGAVPAVQIHRMGYQVGEEGVQSLMDAP